MGRKILPNHTIIEQHRFAKRSEEISPEQENLLGDLLNRSIEIIDAKLKALRPVPAAEERHQQPKRALLPAQFRRTLIRHEPENTQCDCRIQRIGEDVSEKLDYTRACSPSSSMCGEKGHCLHCELPDWPRPTIYC